MLKGMIYAILVELNLHRREGIIVDLIAVLH